MFHADKFQHMSFKLRQKLKFYYHAKNNTAYAEKISLILENCNFNDAKMTKIQKEKHRFLYK